MANETIQQQDEPVFIINPSTTMTTTIDSLNVDAPIKVPYQVLRWFFSTTYPTESLWRMLSLENPQHREFAFTFVDSRQFFVDNIRVSAPKVVVEEEERMQRHASFETYETFVKHIKDRKPCRIDLGGAYLVKPRFARLVACDHDNIVGNPSPEVGYKELTIDIDINEYDSNPRRTCCTGRDICRSCWPIVNVGCISIDICLRSMGARAVGWFFSGGRGMHCWIMDPELCSVDKSIRNLLAWKLAPPHEQSVEFLKILEECGDPAHELVARLFAGDNNCDGMKRKNTDSCDLFDEYCYCNLDTGKLCPIHVHGGFFLGWYARRHPDVAFNTILSKLNFLWQRIKSGGGISGDDSSIISIESEMMKKNKKISREDITKMEFDIGMIEEFQNDIVVASGALSEMRKLCGNKIEVHLETLYSGWDEGDQVLESTKRTCYLFDQLAKRVAQSNLLATEWDTVSIRKLGSFADLQLARAIILASIDCISPRIDLPVVAQTNHLLKAPLSVHPLTGRLAMMMPDKKTLASFFPTDAPRIIFSSQSETSGNYREDSDGRIYDETGEQPHFDEPQKVKSAILTFDTWTKQILTNNVTPSTINI